jgi:hypothetical protein
MMPSSSSTDLDAKGCLVGPASKFVTLSQKDKERHRSATMIALLGNEGGFESDERLIDHGKERYGRIGGLTQREWLSCPVLLETIPTFHQHDE